MCVYVSRSAPVVNQRLVEASWASQTLTLADSLTSRHVNAHQTEADPLYPMPLNILFAPKKNCRYSSRYRFVCEFGNTFDVVLEGEGTYEEHMHRPINPMPKV